MTTEKANLTKKIPSFVLEQEGIFDKLFDRVLSFSSSDIDFPEAPFFSKKMRLRGEDEGAIRALFTQDLLAFFESEEIYHIECNGEALLIFKSLRIANTGEIKNMVRFTEELVKKINK